MNKLTAEKCRQQIEEFQHLVDSESISTKAERHLQAYRIALPVLEQQEKGELVRVAFTGSGSLAAIKRGDEGFIWGSKEDAHPVELFARCKDVVCEKCNGTGQMDSGGTQPWGELILVECDCVVEQQEKGKRSWLHWNGEMALPPVDSEVRVEIKRRNGEVTERQAKWFAWRNSPVKSEFDIIAYRVVENDGREG